ncbi:hypothetical protein IFU00_00790 [Oxalobacteraceae sp. CFBP 8761]|nr:hypothetical protein [Oxalobacteraceae sp. CFBP 8761]
MDVLTVTIERFVDDHFPGFVECILLDSEDCSHRFVEKVPVVTTANLSLDSAYPQPGCIACVVEDEWIDERGRPLARVSTTNPWGVESTTGDTTFTVLRNQIDRV